MKTPLLLIIFNRPETVEEVFDVIMHVKPEKLYIASDAPRNWVIDDEHNCKETRKIVEYINWECDVKYNYFKENLGTKYGPAKAIDWFFSNEEEGIILEHDCLPNLYFFEFCELMLDKFRNNSKIMHINGCNFLLNKIKIDSDYYFSNIPLIWGWATWRRAWERYDVDMKKFQNVPVVIPGNFIQKIMWKQTFEKVYNNSVATWDYQWTYTLFSNDGYAITPSVNLVSNIGFGDKATFGKNINSIYSKLPAESLKVKNHPSIIISNKLADSFLMKTHFNMNVKNLIRRVIKDLVRNIKRN